MADRVTWCRRLMWLGLALLVVRLAQLQIVQGGRYRQQAEQNRLRVVPQPAPRGLLVDRAGRRLATNDMAFRVSAVPQDLPRRPRKGHTGPDPCREVFERLSALVGVPAEELEARFTKNVTVPFVPAELVHPIPKTLALRIEEERLRLPGIVVEPVVSRRYPMGTVAAHLLGYLSQPTAETFPVLKQYGVRPRDLVGRFGLEEELDAYLRGRSGGSLIEVNHRARQVRVLGNQPRVSGQPVTLTIDVALQALIEQLFGGVPGAAVVLQPQTGEVLAMASSPGFDPQAFANQDGDAIRQSLQDPRSVMMNRATMGVYLPGSIIKPISGAVALEQGIITPHTVVECHGYIQFGDRRIHCWNRDGHGPVRIREALMGSCNVFFMEVGRRLGLERLRAGYMGAGLGRRTGWLLTDRAGHLPTRRMSEGEVAMLAMGQGEILLTPLQAALMVSAIANGGWLVEPWVVKRIGEHEVQRVSAVPIGWSKETLEAIWSGMDAVVNDPKGTGIRAHSPHVRIFGKTGTAQTHVQGATHGWFIGFCPGEHPAAALAILAEYGGSGGDLPATIARNVCEYIAVAAQPAAEPMQEAKVR
jgi:penicillin-binding protein 2